jgi:hypothetical protein
MHNAGVVAPIAAHRLLEGASMKTSMKWWLTLFCLVPSSVFATVWLGAPSGTLDDEIRRLGFYPLIPPVTLRTPGSIYYVSHNGSEYAVACEVAPDRLTGVVHDSDSSDSVASSFRAVQFRMDSEAIRNVLSSTEAKLSESIRLELKNVHVLEVTLENLAAISTELQQRSTCREALHSALANNDFLCQGMQVLKASAKYVVATNTSSEVKLHEATELIKTNIDPNVRMESEQASIGDDLYYGMKLTPHCMADRFPPPPLPRPPVTYWNRLVNMFPALDRF